MCCNSGKRCNWTFYNATCTFSKGRFIFSFEIHNIFMPKILNLMLITQRRRKSHKSGPWSNASAMIGKDFRDLAPFLGSNSLSSRHNTHEPAPDPLLSPFLFAASISEPKDTKFDVSLSTDLPTTATQRYLLLPAVIFIWYCLLFPSTCNSY